MNSLKTLMVVGVMGVVAYGVYATLTKAPVGSEDDAESAGPSIEMPVEATATSSNSPAEASFAPKFLPTAPADPAPRYGGKATITDEPDVDLPTDPLDSTAAPVRNPREIAARGAGRPGAKSYAMAEDSTADNGVLATTAVSEEFPAAASSKSAEFQQAMAHVHELLAQNHLAEALRALTPWHERKLPPIEQAEVTTLLDQLAGTVVYSRQHLLAPPHIVQPGENLQQIAARYNMPWQLLAKINGLGNPPKLRPGESLKVMQGPFSAVVDEGHYRLTLYVAGCYAGRFQIGLGNAVNAPAGRYEVQDKIENPTYTTAEGHEFSADDPQNPVGEYWIELGQGVGIHGTIDPDSIGSPTTDGGVRLNAADIEHVYDMLSIGSPVMIRRE